MHCAKRPDDRAMARTFERQVVERHVRLTLLNRFTLVCRPTTPAVVIMAPLRPRQEQA